MAKGQLGLFFLTRWYFIIRSFFMSREKLEAELEALRLELEELRREHGEEGGAMRSKEELMAEFEEAAHNVAEPLFDEGAEEANAQILQLTRAVHEIAGLPLKERDERRQRLVKAVCPHGQHAKKMLADILDELIDRWNKLYPDMVPTKEELETAERQRGDGPG